MSAEPKTVAIIPARWDSTRFPGKPLAPLSGKPMLQWVVEAAGKAQCIDKVIVATDDSRIENVVKGFGGEVCMTSPDHHSGSDRIAEVAESLHCQYIVNIQGDEPLLQPGQIDLVVQGLKEHPDISVSTLKTPINNSEDAHNPNVVKVVTDSFGRALYFSRASIPHCRDGAGKSEEPLQFRHLGLYAFRREFLLEFTQWPPTPLEKLEKLEQLRILEEGHSIMVMVTDHDSPGVDTPEDLVRVEQLIMSNSSN